jgi:hypothetical protein
MRLRRDRVHLGNESFLVFKIQRHVFLLLEDHSQKGPSSISAPTLATVTFTSGH